jgi:hypothetical protein
MLDRNLTHFGIDWIQIKFLEEKCLTQEKIALRDADAFVHEDDIN